jgi:hypothetical protein
MAVQGFRSILTYKRSQSRAIQAESLPNRESNSNYPFLKPRLTIEKLVEAASTDKTM